MGKEGYGRGGLKEGQEKERGWEEGNVRGERGWGWREGWRETLVHERGRYQRGRREEKVTDRWKDEAMCAGNDTRNEKILDIIPV